MGARLYRAKKMAINGKVVVTVYYWVCNNRCNIFNNTQKKWVKEIELYGNNISVSLELGWHKSEAGSALQCTY